MANEPPREKTAIAWSQLSQDQKNDIANKVVAALNSIGIKDARARWKMSKQLAHWQLIIETSWRASKSQSDVSRTLGQAIARAEIYMPMNSIVLKSPKEKRRKSHAKEIN
jgi:hypothetical protein